MDPYKRQIKLSEHLKVCADGQHSVLQFYKVRVTNRLIKNAQKLLRIIYMSPENDNIISLIIMLRTRRCPSYLKLSVPSDSY